MTLGQPVRTCACKVLGGALDAAEWQTVQDGVQVKVAETSEKTVGGDGKETVARGDTFVLTKSQARSLKETAMRVKKVRGAMKTLFALDARIGRSKWRKAGPSKRELTRDELVSRLAVAKAKAGRAWKMVDVVMPTTDGRMVTLPRYVEPKADVAILLDRLGLTLPAQPPPKISGDLAETAKAEV